MVGSILGMIGGLGMIVAALSMPRLQPPPSDSLLMSPPELIKHMTLGYDESIADSLWIRTIQDFDVCEQKGKSALPTYTDANPPPKDQPAITQREARCKKGWVFRMLNAITEVAPRFVAPWLNGVITLSVVGDDREGAAVLFEKGMPYMRENWMYTYRAAYHFLVELNQPKRASELLLEAGKHGAPYWVNLLAARLMTKEGQIELAESVLRERAENHEDPAQREVFAKRLAEVREQIKKNQAPEKN